MDCYVVETPTEHKSSKRGHFTGATPFSPDPNKRLSNQRNQETMHCTELGAAEYTNQRHAWLQDMILG
jgi:hypothetical protein